MHKPLSVCFLVFLIWQELIEKQDINEHSYVGCVK